MKLNGTAVKDETRDDFTPAPTAGARQLTDEERAKIALANTLVREAYDLINEVFTSPMPVGMVQWIPIEKVRANGWNPNSVAGQEMKLLHTSIDADGYTQPVVAVWDADNDCAVIVDGYHRYTVMRRYPDIHDRTGGYLPVVLIDKPLADRIASTVRHNRARGKHSVAGMGNLVFQMLQEGEDDATICHKLGLEAEELARLKHITGFSKLFADIPSYSKVTVTKAQLKAKADYKREHPEEEVQPW